MHTRVVAIILTFPLSMVSRSDAYYFRGPDQRHTNRISSNDLFFLKSAEAPATTEIATPSAAATTPATTTAAAAAATAAAQNTFEIKSREPEVLLSQAQSDFFVLNTTGSGDDSPEKILVGEEDGQIRHSTGYANVGKTAPMLLVNAPDGRRVPEDPDYYRDPRFYVRNSVRLRNGDGIDILRLFPRRDGPQARYGGMLDIARVVDQVLENSNAGSDSFTLLNDADSQVAIVVERSRTDPVRDFDQPDQTKAADKVEISGKLKDPSEFASEAADQIKEESERKVDDEKKALKEIIINLLKRPAPTDNKRTKTEVRH